MKVKNKILTTMLISLSILSTNVKSENHCDIEKFHKIAAVEVEEIFKLIQTGNYENDLNKIWEQYESKYNLYTNICWVLYLNKFPHKERFKNYNDYAKAITPSEEDLTELYNKKNFEHTNFNPWKLPFILAAILNQPQYIIDFYSIFKKQIESDDKRDYITIANYYAQKLKNSGIDRTEIINLLEHK